MASYGRMRGSSSKKYGRREQITERVPDFLLDPLNILVIGPTQNGKSTFINKFLSLSQIDQGDGAPIGDGFRSCTTECGTYEVDMPTTTWKAVDADRNVDFEIPENEETIFSTFARKGNLKVVPVHPDSTRVKLRLIDTPGLDDTQGRDAENIQKVLQRLASYAEDADASKRYVNAIVFIISMHTSFSDSFQQFYEYYEKCMPNLFGGLAIVNTNFTMDVWKSKSQAYRLRNLTGGGAGGSAKAHVMKQRRSDFAEVFEKDPRHFFIDSDPSKRFPFEQLTTLNTLSEIVNYFTSQGKMPIAQMRLFKFPNMISADLKLAGYLLSIKNYWSREQERLLQSASAAEKVRSGLTKIGHETQADIDELEKDIKRWDTEDEYKLNPYTTHDDISMPNRVWKFVTISRFKNSLAIREKVEPFWVTLTDSTVASWSRPSLDPASNTWNCPYEAKFGKTPLLSAQSWTKNRHFHAAEITRARRALREKQVLLLNNEGLQAAEAMRADPAKDNPRTVRMGEHIAKCASLVRELKSEQAPLAEGFNLQVAKRYAKESQNVGLEDLWDMVRSEDQGFSQDLMAAASECKI